jgi:DNA-directed RNA polymerase specialized sigma24 family protein
MAMLSPLERTALVMTALEGSTYEAAALVLGTSAGALRAAVSRARTKLENA